LVLSSPSAMAFVTVRIQTIDVHVHTSKDWNALEISTLSS